MDQETATGIYGSDPVHKTGITALFTPEEPSVDIVFIHGFTGHPERTWTCKQGDIAQRNDITSDRGQVHEPPSKIRKLNPFSSSSRDGGSSANRAVYWPRDLVPTTIPSARVLTYGYDTHIAWKGSPATTTTVYDLASDFLVALEAYRQSDQSRPILFVVHSLGGIIVKEMLRQSRLGQQGQANVRSIFDSTIGIIFFGTPHAGADPRSFLHRIAERVIKVTGLSVNEQIVNALLPTSERLRELRDEFPPMAQDQNWAIHSFQEQVGVRLLLDQKVVDNTSSYLNIPAIETTEHIARNHMEMCRFTGPNDVEYQKVAAALRRITNTKCQRREDPGKLALNKDQRRSLLESLKFEQIDTHRMTIKNAHASTCRWLLEQPEYLDWLDHTKFVDHHGFLWIKGNPGTGKSTLMKFALADARKTMKDAVTIFFFFNARGATLEKSTIGMYRSLLLQLLERLPALQDVFDTLGLAVWDSLCKQWSIESLKELFEQAILRLGESSLVCFIDALDECDDHQIRDMLSFFDHLGELIASAGIQFRVCFSSRHYPEITISKGLGLKLEEQDGHTQDITRYVQSELKIGHSKLAEQIRAELQEKAAGVFIWVFLVVEILNKEYDDGRPDALRKRLKDIPKDLHDLFRDILTRDHHKRAELRLCIQWLLFSVRPLKPKQLYFAILSGSEPEVLSECDPDEVTGPVIRKFIVSSSKGLAEVTRSKNPTVQFIHETVKDFLLKKNGFRKSGQTSVIISKESHELLKRCCLNQMNIDMTTSFRVPKRLPKATSDEAAELRQLANTRFPFLEYAVRNVLYHADRAQAASVDQTSWLGSFQTAKWISVHNLIEPRQVRRYNPTTGLLYILAEHNMAALIGVHPSKKSCFDAEDERYGPPIFAALATESDDALKALMDAHSELQSRIPLLHDLCKQFIEDRNKYANFGRQFSFSPPHSILSVVSKSETLFAFYISTGDMHITDLRGRNTLTIAIEKGYETVVKLILDKERVDVNSNHNDKKETTVWHAALRNAIEFRSESVVKLLLDTERADLHTKHLSQKLLWLAAEEGQAGVFKLLLATGRFNPNLGDTSGRTPLSLAAEARSAAVVELLLATGEVDPNSTDTGGRTPLWWAAYGGSKSVVKLLLDTRKVDPNFRDNEGCTPLRIAASGGYDSVVELLLDTGKVDPNSADAGGWTLLWWAARTGHEVVVKQLLDAGKVDPDSTDSNGRTPLWWAARKGHESVVKLLLDTGKVDIKSTDSHGRTPTSIALKEGHLAIFDRLAFATGEVDLNS